MTEDIKLTSLLNLIQSKNYFTEKGTERFTKLLERGDDESEYVSIAKVEAALVMYFVTIKVQEAKGELI